MTLKWWLLIKCIPAEEEKASAPNVASCCNSHPAIKLSQRKHSSFYVHFQGIMHWYIRQCSYFRKTCLQSECQRQYISNKSNKPHIYFAFLSAYSCQGECDCCSRGRCTSNHQEVSCYHEHCFEIGGMCVVKQKIISSYDRWIPLLFYYYYPENLWWEGPLLSSATVLQYFKLFLSLSKLSLDPNTSNTCLWYTNICLCKYILIQIFNLAR